MADTLPKMPDEENSIIRVMQPTGEEPYVDLNTPGSSSTGMIGGQYYGNPEELPAALNEISRLEDLAARARARKPPAEGTVIPDYSAGGRDSFRSKIVGKLGFDPTTLDPYEELARIEKESLPAIFNKFFRGKVLWADRDKLNSKQKTAWQDEYNRFRAYIYNRIEQKKKIGSDVMEEGLKRWDAKAKEHKNLVDQIREETAAEAKALREAEEKAGQPPRTLNMENDKGVVTVHEWDSAARSWKDTGKRSNVGRGPTSAQQVKQLEFEEEALLGIEPGEKIPDEVLAAINARREARGMPKLVERVWAQPQKERAFGKPGTPLGLLGDWMKPDIPGQYSYAEEGSEAAGEATVAAPAAGDIESQIRTRFPGAYKGTDGKWYVKQGGKTYEIEAY